MAELAVAREVSNAPEPLIVAPLLGEVPRSLYDEEDLKAYIREELMLAEAERDELETKWARWQEVYDAPMATETKDFPFEGAANLTVPVAKEVINSLTSGFLQTILTPRPTWVFKDLAAEWSPFKSIIEQFMDLSARREMKLPTVLETWILEAAKLGTSIVKHGWDYREREFPRYVGDGSEFTTEMRVFKDGPAVWRVSLQDFFIRLFETDLQEAQWVSQRYRLNERQIKERAANGKYRKDAAESILELEEQPEEDEVLEAKEDLEDSEPATRDQWTFHEVWISWQLEGRDSDTELVVDYHPETETIMSVRFHPYWHGRRPFVKLVYFPVEDRFYGDGLCKQLEALQLEISTTHNQRLDNATLANMVMLLVRRMSRSIKPGDKLFPGKRVMVNNPDDVSPLRLGEIYPSTVTNEQITRQYVERISGVSEPQLKGGMPVTRTTAAAQSMLLAEGAKRFDQTIRKIREGVAEIGEFTLSLYFQFGAGDKPMRWFGDRGRVVAAVFRLPARASELGLGIEASAPTSQLNKEQQRENSLALFNLMVALYERFTQYMASLAQFQLVDPQVLLHIGGAMASSAKQFMFQTLEQFDVTNPEEVLAGLTVLERVLPTPEDMGGLESFERAERDAEVMEQLSRLEDILRETPRDERGFAGVPPRRSELRSVPREERVPRRPGTDNEAPGRNGPRP